MALKPNAPIYAPFIEFLNGMQLAHLTNTTIQVAAGNCSDSTVINEISLAAAVTINAAANGLNGLDTGSLANNSFYAVLAIGDSTDKNPAGAMLTLTPAAPFLPFGYDMYRRIGYVLTDGSAHILPFTQRKEGRDRDMFYADAIATNITAGASTTFAAVTASASVPASAKEVFVNAVLTADAGGTRVAALKATSSASTAGQVKMSSPASTVTNASLLCPCDANGAISYLVSNASAALALNIFGYVDSL